MAKYSNFICLVSVRNATDLSHLLTWLIFNLKSYAQIIAKLKVA